MNITIPALPVNKTYYIEGESHFSLQQPPNPQDHPDSSPQKFRKTSLNRKVQELNIPNNFFQQTTKLEYMPPMVKYTVSAQQEDVAFSLRKAQVNVQICSDMEHMVEGFKYLWQFYTWVVTLGNMPKPKMRCVID